MNEIKSTHSKLRFCVGIEGFIDEFDPTFCCIWRIKHMIDPL